MQPAREQGTSLPPLPPSLKERLVAAAKAAPSPTRAVQRRRAAMAVGTAVALALAIFFAAGGVRPTGRPGLLMATTFGGTAFFGLVSLRIAFSRGRTLLGRPRAWLLGSALVAPVALLLWKVGWSAEFEHGTDPWATRAGLRCLGLSLAIGALPIAAMLFARRRTDPTHPGATGLAIGSAGGVVTAALVDAWCPVAYVPHLLVGHLLPILVFGIVGWLLGRMLLLL